MNRALAPHFLVLLFLVRAVCAQSSFVNFETAPVHPVALSPDGKTLAVCNLPDARVEFFDISAGVPKQLGSVFTGIDPVTARFNHAGELWVVNHISDSITVIDPVTRKVLATLDTFDAPADVVFTKQGRAFVSHTMPNVVLVFDVASRASLASLDIDGDRPKAMALSADESEIYVAILESGNSSTIIAPALTGLERHPQPTVVELPGAPHGGLNPFPNFGEVFSPLINTNIPATNPPPRVSLIVRKQAGRWMDDNKGDWTEFISGTNAFLTGRVPGWDVADHDIAIINTTNGSIRYVRGLMNICFDLSVNPMNGQVALIGTDAINEVRFEPVLKSVFVKSKIAFVDTKAGTNRVVDLNPHLDYKTQSLMAAERRESVGDPRAIAWNSRLGRAYVTGMGSDNIVMIDSSGARIGQAKELPEGPTGMAVDEARGRVYVFSRFASKLVTLDAESLAILNTVAMHDPTPAAVRAGRKHFYSTQKNSGLGQVACASCHIDGRFDRLAWDLGNPEGEMLALTNRFDGNKQTTGSFHPMKGPMVTQTLVDIIGHEPFHWRGDKDGIEQFNETFMALQGADSELTDEEMHEFKDFLASLTFPPNPRRNLDNSLPTALELTERSLGRGTLPAGARLPDGDAAQGVNQFIFTQACTACHTFPTGMGVDGATTNGLPIPFGPNGERHLRLLSLARSSDLPFKVPQLRDLPDKVGFSLKGPISRAGFGFLHDGRVDSLTQFVQDGFNVINDEDTADMIALMMSFSGSDFTRAGGALSNPVGPPSQDVPAGVGFQTVLTNAVSNARLLFMTSHARSSTSRVDLVVHAAPGGKARGWLMQGQTFNADKTNETATLSTLLVLATPQTPVVFTLVPLGSGNRMALDLDGDGFLNQNEIDVGSDPADASVTPETTTPRLLVIKYLGEAIQLQWHGRIGSNYRVQMRTDLAATSTWENLDEPILLTKNPESWTASFETAANARYYRIIHEP